MMTPHFIEGSMTIYFTDGSIMTCNEIEVGFDGLIVDGYRLVPTADVLRITATR